MASIRKRGNSYLIVVSMGYDYKGARIKPRQKTVHPPEGLTPKQREKWLQEQAVLFERSCRDNPEEPTTPITLAAYIDLWLRKSPPASWPSPPSAGTNRTSSASSQPWATTSSRNCGRSTSGLSTPSSVKPSAQKPKSHSLSTPLRACTLRCAASSPMPWRVAFCVITPAWRTYRYAGRKAEKKIADAETVGKIISALEEESIKYETYFKLVIATGMRRGECCALQWGDIDWEHRSIHIRRNAVKVTDEEIFTKAPKTVSGDRYVYFSLEMESLLREYRQECAWETETYDGRELENEDFLFRRKGCRLPMTPSTFTWRFKLILKKHDLPEYLNVHSLRHTNASLLIANGTDVATVAGLLGHSQPSTTLDIYTHAFDKNKQVASRALQEGLEI